MIDKKTVEHIAHLSRLTLNEDQKNKFARDLSNALNYFEQISQISTTGIEALRTPVDIETIWREDIAQNDFAPEEMTANAPSKAGNLFKVPPVV